MDYYFTFTTTYKLNSITNVTQRYLLIVLIQCSCITVLSPSSSITTTCSEPPFMATAAHILFIPRYYITLSSNWATMF